IFTKDFGFEIADLTFLGYSNGANMILATALKYPSLFYRVILLHGMLPFDSQVVDLKHLDSLITLGENDQMIPAKESYKMIETLKSNQANVEVVSHPGGHEIRQNELEAIEKFLKV